MEKTEVIKTEDRRKEERSLARRVELFKPFMKAGVLKPSLDNVNHNHSIIPVHVQLPAMEGNPSSLMNIKSHLKQYGSFACIPKYCNANQNYIRNNNLEHKWFYLTVDGKPQLLILNLQENQYRCNKL